MGAIVAGLLCAGVLYEGVRNGKIDGAIEAVKEVMKKEMERAGEERKAQEERGKRTEEVKRKEIELLRKEQELSEKIMEVIAERYPDCLTKIKKVANEKKRLKKARKLSDQQIDQNPLKIEAKLLLELDTSSKKYTKLSISEPTASSEDESPSNPLPKTPSKKPQSPTQNPEILSFTV
ncbi:unnamed protein product [Moneuplotes crassus]|uniref:Uncharacterized protein n=1 Tax=Euplotes crassus TaxID=5936 RepID=A0AAD2D5N9_EUPCR|nr:unnamed protein product [Moneuplotes crassus]